MAFPSQVNPPQIGLREASLVDPDARRAVAGTLAVPVLPADPADASGAAESAGSGTPILGPGTAVVLDLLAEHGVTGDDVFGLLEAAGARGAAGEVTVLPLHRGVVEEVLLVGVGAAAPADLRKAGAAIARHTRDREAVATSLSALAEPEGFRALVDGLILGSFGFHWRSAGPEHRPVGSVVLTDIPDEVAYAELLGRATAVAGAGWFSRMLALMPSNLKNPQWLAEQAAQVATRTGLDLEVWDETRLRAEGFGGIAGVGQASDSPPRLIRLGYTPAGASASSDLPHVVLVGKGITFDTGGLSIKPADAMANMKRDMTGGGVVLAVLGALAELDCPVRVTGLIAAAENSISGSALRPGDVVTHYGGRTSEVTNTDAEGRLVMADALAYAAAQLAPTVLVDVATLTGAIKVALGQRTGGMFANDDALAEQLRAAGEAAGEVLWRLPLAQEYAELLDSPIADADNAPGGPGAITAALFLEPFAAGLPWAHLDIASVGDSPVDAFEWTSGATGFGARLLLRWLEQAG